MKTTCVVNTTHPFSHNSFYSEFEGVRYPRETIQRFSQSTNYWLVLSIDNRILIIRKFYDSVKQQSSWSCDENNQKTKFSQVTLIKKDEGQGIKMLHIHRHRRWNREDCYFEQYSRRDSLFIITEKSKDKEINTGLNKTCLFPSE